MNETEEEYYKSKLLLKVSEKELDGWIKRNKPPRYWKYGKYAYAYAEMPTGRLFTWFRKKILKWEI